MKWKREASLFDEGNVFARAWKNHMRRRGATLQQTQAPLKMSLEILTNIRSASPPTGEFVTDRSAAALLKNRADIDEAIKQVGDLIDMESNLALVDDYDELKGKTAKLYDLSYNDSQTPSEEIEQALIRGGQITEEDLRRGAKWIDEAGTTKPPKIKPIAGTSLSSRLDTINHDITLKSAEQIIDTIIEAVPQVTVEDLGYNYRDVISGTAPIEAYEEILRASGSKFSPEEIKLGARVLSKSHISQTVKGSKRDISLSELIIGDTTILTKPPDDASPLRKKYKPVFKLRPKPEQGLVINPGSLSLSSDAVDLSYSKVDYDLPVSRPRSMKAYKKRVRDQRRINFSSV